MNIGRIPGVFIQAQRLGWSSQRKVALVSAPLCDSHFSHFQKAIWASCQEASRLAQRRLPPQLLLHKHIRLSLNILMVAGTT